jgi:Leucine-rich repeat (LRR) protein
MKSQIELIIVLINCVISRVASQSPACEVKIGPLTCSCTESPNNHLKTYKFCSLFDSTSINSRDVYCSGNLANEILTLDRFNTQPSILCNLIKPAEKLKFPDFSNNAFSKSFYSVVIRNRNFKLVPNFSFQFLQIELLELSNNQIEVAAEKAFDKIEGLRSLDVSNNQINEIEVSYLTDLEVLDLSRNKLNTIEASLLMNMTKLKYLALFYNSIEAIDRLAFSTNSDLRYLDLSGNKLKSVNFGLDLKWLVSFNLNENDIVNMASDVFSNLTSVKILMIEKNELDKIDPNELSNLNQLKLLTIDKNILESIDLEQITFFLDSLVTLTMSNNKFESIKSASSNGSCQRKNKLMDLDLNSNSIIEIELFSFACFGSLTQLDLSNLMLTNLPGAGLFYGLSSLRKLKINNNSLTNISKNSFIYLQKLSFLDLSSNQLQYLETDTFAGLIVLTELYLDDNCLKKLNSNVFKSMRNLLKIELRRNKLTEIEPNSVYGLEKCLKTLKLYRNRLGFLKNHFFTNLSRLEILDLRDNQISSIQSDTFKDLASLLTLDLSDNSIAKIDPSIFINLANLDILDLSFNCLVDLRPESFRYLNQLLDLNLGFNSLVKVNFQRIFPNKSIILLEKLNLENNIISELDMNWFSSLSKLKELNLDNNNFNMRVVEKNDNNISILANLKFLKLRNASLRLVSQFNLSSLLEIDFSNSELDQSLLQSLPFDTVQVLKLANISGFWFSFLNWKKFGSKLRVIDFSYNRISFLDIFVKLNSSRDLKGIVLKYTKLNDTVLSRIDFSPFQNLTDLDLSCNRISTMPDYFLRHLAELINLNLSSNSIRKISMFHFGYNSKLKFIDLSRNLINEIDESSFLIHTSLVHLDLSFNNLSNLDQLIFSKNRLSYLIRVLLNDNHLGKCEIYFGNATIESINLAGNNLIDIPSTIVNKIKAVDLIDLSRNGLTSITTRHFQTTNSMLDLLLSRNRVKTIEAKAFAMCKHLTRLDLSFNRFSNLTTQTFEGLYNLQVLNLSSNKLEIIQNGLLDKLVDLKKLDLTNNSIRFVEEGCFSQNKLHSEIYLRGNPLKRFFKNHTLNGLSSLDYLELPEQVEFNDETCLILKNTVIMRFVKQSVNVGYFDTIDIVTMDRIGRVYNKIECFHIIYLSRNKISLNIYYEEWVQKFVESCSDWAADAFVNEKLPLLFKT